MGHQKRPRYSLVLPEELYDKIDKLAKSHQTTAVDVIRRFFTLGLIAVQDDVTLMVKKGDEPLREVLLL